MKILCDQNVHTKYTEAFQRTEWITVEQVRDVLPIDTDDPEIIEYAAANGWVVFTSDVRFLSADEEEGNIEPDATACGVVFYRQAENPSPGDVIAALRLIAQGYDDYGDIETHVPGEWG